MTIIKYLLVMLISLSFQPKQKELKKIVETSNYSWIGYGGARGGAKSYGIDNLALAFGFKYKTYSLIFRRYYNELLDNHINPLFQRFPALRPFYNSSDKILYHPTLRIPIIRFGYAENEADIYKFQGPSYPLIFVDEATQSTQEMIQFLKTSNRDPSGLFPTNAKMVLTANPGGVGHAFYNRIFIDKVYQDNEKGENYYFIQSHVWDNVSWSLRELRLRGISVDDYYNVWTEKQRIDFTLQHSDYAQNLAGLPEQLKLAYLDGRWDVFAGMFFKGFSANKEIIEPFAIPVDWSLVGSLDPGFASPLSYGLTAKDFKGNIYRIGTYYAIDKIPNHATNIKQWLTSDKSPIWSITKGRLPDYTVAGRDAFAKLDKNAIQSNEDTVESYFTAAGIPLSQGNDGSGTRIPNWWTWKSLIPDKYFIFKGLGNNVLTTQMTAVESDKRNPEDIQGAGNDPTVEDHALDEQKLGIAALSKPQARNKQPDLPDWFVKAKARAKNKHEISVMGV